MTRAQVEIMSAPPAPLHSAAQAKSCPFAANCSCVFNRVQADQAETPSLGRYSMAVRAEIESYTVRGYTVVSADSREVVLERRRPMSFCVNAALTLLTGFLWLIYWIPKARHPKIETVVLTVSPNQGVGRAGGVPRRDWKTSQTSALSR